jgi:phage terminase small subunit
MIGKHVRVNAFQDVVKHRGLKSLADRLERARKRDAEAKP